MKPQTLSSIDPINPVKLSFYTYFPLYSCRQNGANTQPAIQPKPDPSMPLIADTRSPAIRPHATCSLFSIIVRSVLKGLAARQVFSSWCLLPSHIPHPTPPPTSTSSPRFLTIPLPLSPCTVPKNKPWTTLELRSVQRHSTTYPDFWYPESGVWISINSSVACASC